MTERNNYIENLNTILTQYKDVFGLYTPYPQVKHEFFEEVENFAFNFALEIFDEFGLKYAYPTIKLSFGTLNLVYQASDFVLIIEFTEGSKMIKFTGNDEKGNKVNGQLNTEKMPLSPLLFMHV